MVWLRSFLIVLAISALLARLGPFGTFAELAPVERAAYWVGLTLLLWLQIEVARHVLRGWKAHWAVRGAAAAAIGAIPSAFEVAWAESLLRVERDLGLVDLVKIYGDALLIALSLSLLLEFIASRGASRSGPALSTPGARAGDALVAALPPERRGRLLAFAAEDHYLRVFTDRGEDLILRRFADAIAEVGAIDGLRVHRSWWVARDAVTGTERDGERMMLRLSNGVGVPVSRTYLLTVREAGLAG